MAAPHVLQVFQPRTGGVPRYVLNLTAGLLARGLQVTVACPADVDGAARVRAAGARFVTLDVGRSPGPGRDARAARMLADLCAPGGASVIHSHSTKAGLLGAGAGRLAGVPSVYSPHGWAFQMTVGTPRRVAFALVERTLTRHCHAAVLAVSAAERAAAERWLVSPRGRIRVVWTGLPPSAAPSQGPGRAAARSALGLDPEAVVAAWVGRAGAQKRPQDLAPLARALRGHATVVALCDGLRGDPLAGELRAAGVVVLDGDCEPRTLYAAADLFVQTSAWEGFPLTVLEAMAARLAVLAYAVGGVPEQVGHGTCGYLVAAGDVAALARHAAELAGDAERRSAMGEAARERQAEHFSFHAMLDAVEQTYRAVTAPSAPPPAEAAQGRSDGAGRELQMST